MPVKLTSPIVLLCSERSGSNLIAKVFDAHPKVSGPGAAHLFKVMSEVAHTFDPDSEDLREAVLELFQAKVSAWQIDEMGIETHRGLLENCETAAQMCASLYQAEADRQGKQHVLLKENSAFAYLPMLSGISSDLRLLFMVRDPRDMAVSWINGPVMRGGAIRAAERWLKDQSGTFRTFATTGADIKKATLRYEDLLADPEIHLKRVCTELKLDFSEEMLRFSEKSTSAKKDSGRSSMWSNLNKPLISGNTQKFRKSLTTEQIQYIETVCGDYMEVLGYPLVNDPATLPGTPEELAELRRSIEPIEPYDKPAYQELPQEERDRFEKWSRLYKQLSARAPRPVQVSK
ncbi:sulfotransferase family protein [Shimia isoporae]|uniref:Sulfotransferase family protein n=1 Tax=Shimia isoporae TaxID=647720 RepID=A0A4R1N5J5_9RHOB|nr:sulfotransferase [Shimia isoporae]TCK99775.1 sulfotransferase family protein [Shimia isoporae]